MQAQHAFYSQNNPASQGIQTTPDNRRSAFQEKSEVPDQTKDKSPS